MTQTGKEFKFDKLVISLETIFGQTSTVRGKKVYHQDDENEEYEEEGDENDYYDAEYAEEEEPWEEVDEYWYEDAEEWEEPVDYAYYTEAPAPVAGVETYDDVYVNY